LFSKALTTLRQVSDIFKNTVHVYDCSTCQSFFVNVGLLCNRSRLVRDQDHAFDDWTLFVTLTDPPCLLPDMPSQVSWVINLIMRNAQTEPLQTSIVLPGHLTQQTLIPLAAFLLEYPVAYVPASSEQTIFLNGVPLDVYECFVELHPSFILRGKPAILSHTLLKFSCPSTLCLENDRLSVAVLKEQLRDRFKSRSENIEEYYRLEVRHDMKTLDRVGL